MWPQPACSFLRRCLDHILIVKVKRADLVGQLGGDQWGTFLWLRLSAHPPPWGTERAGRGGSRSQGVSGALGQCAVSDALPQASTS